MLRMLQNWRGPVEINGRRYASIQEATVDLKSFNGQIRINLYPNVETADRHSVSTTATSAVRETPQEYRITVKKYMTQQAEPGFDFMAKWNNNNPMPLRIMTGTIEKETRGMVYMKLHGDIWAKKICTCMKCGKPLTNPVSQFFGIGPECGGHNYVSPFEDEDQLNEAVAQYKAKLQAVTWEGWVIKSAIIAQEEVEK